jgi:glycosyltransferase involved in cell wall biosynthesis
MIQPTAVTVCQILHGLNVGGAEVLAARLARQLREVYRFVFVCLDELGTLGEALRDEGFPVEVIGRRPGLDFRCARRLADIMRRERVDLVHAHQYTPFFYGAVARVFYRRLPMLMTEHGRAFPDYPRRKRMLANRVLLARRDRVVGVGQSVRRALIANEGFPAARVGVIFNGIDMYQFTVRRDREAVRRELGLGPENLVILQVARLDPLKDHATAIRVINHLAHRNPDSRLILVGQGPEETAIREKVEAWGLTDRVRFLGLRTDVARLLSAADLFLLTSVSEGIPLVLIEAMAAGLPVVSTDVGGVGEVVEDGRTGLLAPSGDDGALAEKVLLLARDPAECERMGRAGRVRAETMFSERQMHAAYLRLYGEMLEGRPRAIAADTLGRVKIYNT